MPTVKCGFDDQTGQSGRDALPHKDAPTIAVRLERLRVFRA